MKKVSTQKTRHKKAFHTSTPESESVTPPNVFLAKKFHELMFNPIFYLSIALITVIGLRLYKAHYTGIVFDEAWTFDTFCINFKTVFTEYHTNNHILNSAFIVLTKMFLAGYEHYPRIPAVLFGILFCTALMDIVNQTIKSSMLKFVVSMLILLNWFIFDLTYLARGYAIALGVTFGSMALLLRWFSKSQEQGKNMWKIVFVLKVMNFLAMGSMLSSLSIVLTLNLAFVLFTIFPLLKQKRKNWKKTLAGLLVLVTGSAVSLYLIYQHIFSKVLRFGKRFEQEPFSNYMTKALKQPLIYFDHFRIRFNIALFNWALILVCVCIVIYLISIIIKLTKTKKINFSSFRNPFMLVLLFTGSVFLLMFVQNMFFGISLGMPRNGVFLLVLVLLSSGILVDQTISAFSGIRMFYLRSFFQCALHLICVVIVALLCYLNLPSLKAVDIRITDWSEQSVVGPLARTLRKIDPEKTWKIRLKRQTRPCRRSIWYYAKFGHRLKYVPDSEKNYDLFIIPLSSMSQPVVLFQKNRFIDYHCMIIANMNSFNNTPVIVEVCPDFSGNRFERPKLLKPKNK